MDNNKLVAAYRKIRDARSAATKAYEAKDAEYKEKLETLETAMLKILLDANTNSMATDAGTFYKTEVIKPAAADWDTFYNWIIENNALDALERRIKVAFVKDYMEQHEGEIPPGLNVYRENKVTVRKAN